MRCIGEMTNLSEKSLRAPAGRLLTYVFPRRSTARRAFTSCKTWLHKGD